MTLRVLHILPHSGGGAETYLQLLSDLDGLNRQHLEQQHFEQRFEQQRFELSAARTPLAAAPSIAVRWVRLARKVSKVDLLHVHGDAAAMLTLPLLARTPAVWTTHGLHLLRRRPNMAPAIRAAMRRTAVTICTSQAEARELEKIAPELRGRLLVVPNGVPLPDALDPKLRIEVRGELGLPEDRLAVLFLGELEQRKRPLDAVAAAEMAHAAGAPVTLLVAGGGPLQEQIRARSGPAIRVLGFREDPLRLLAGADAFVLPSAREGHSFALLEAMGHGVPVVVADGPGSTEAVGEAGVVVRAGDPSALSEALVQLASDPERRQRLGAAARERVAHEFTPERLRAGVLQAYERALTGPARATFAASA